VSYNPLFDLVTGTVLILVPLIVLVGLGVGLLVVSRKPDKRGSESLPETPDKSVSDEVSRSLELLHEHQARLCRELQGLSDENHESLRILIRETANIRSLLEREIRLREEKELSFPHESATS
jgi:hypothetical protein